MPSTVQETRQIRAWRGDFGREYTDRNAYTPAELDQLYLRNYGITRTQVNERFLAGIPSNARILEVGCNMGNQLQLLQKMGYCNLYGIEVQRYALELARKRVPGALLTEATAFAIPYPDRFFDLVFTSGVLIHITPADLPRALEELHRCTREWIWGFEYFAQQTTEVTYRGHNSLLWKTDYARHYMEQFPNLALVREDRLSYVDNDNVDTVFMLRRDN